MQAYARTNRLDSLHRLSSKLSSDLDMQSRGGSPSPMATSSQQSALRAHSAALRTQSTLSSFGTPRASEVVDLSPRIFHTPPSTPALRVPDSALSEYHSVLPAAFNQEERLLRLENELAKQARYTQEQAEWAQKKVAAIADTVGESIRQLQATMLGDKAELQGVCSGIEARLRTADDDHTQRALQHHQYFSEGLSAMRDKLSKEATALSSKLEQQGSATQAGFDRVQADFAMQLTTLNNKLDAETAATRADIDGVNAKFVDICVGLDNKAANQDAAQAARSDKLEWSMSKQVAELERSVAADREERRRMTEHVRATAAQQLLDGLGSMQEHLEQKLKEQEHARVDLKLDVVGQIDRQAVRVDVLDSDEGLRGESARGDATVAGAVAELRDDMEKNVVRGLATLETSVRLRVADLETRTADCEEAVQQLDNALHEDEGMLQPQLKTIEQDLSELHSDVILLKSVVHGANMS